MKLRDLEETSLLHDLRDPQFAQEYLEEILLDGSLDALLLAIRCVARANGGMQKVAQKAKLGRESMYKALSKNGNPQFATLQAILRSVGLRFSVASL